MLSYQEIFNIQKTTLPLTKKELEGVLSKSVFTGYVQCSYSVLVQTLKDIATAESYQCTINPEQMYQNGNNPFEKGDCIIQIEGTRYYEEFINRVSEFGGIPEEILKSKSYMEYYIEVLRSDYKLVYELPRYLQKKNINCKFDVICGNNDLIVNDSVIEWGQIACQEYNLFRYKGDHFSILDKVMNRELKEYFKSIF